MSPRRRWRFALITPLLALLVLSCSEKQATEPAVHPPGGGTPPPPGDTIAPTVSQVTPADHAELVDRGTTVRAVFSEAVAETSVTAQTFQVGGNGAVAGSFTVSGTTVTFTPSSPLAGERTYTATLTTGIHDRSGNALEQPYSWSFTTAGQAPVANAGPDQNVEFGATVVLDGRLSFDPDGKSLSYTWTQTGGVDVTGGVGSLIGAEPSFTAPSVTTTIKFDLTVFDGLETSLPDPIQIFVSGDDVPPSVAQVDPVSNATNVDPSTAVSAFFSESIAENTATTQSFTLTGENGPVAGSVTASGATATFTPSSPLQGDRTYTAALTTDIRDLQGNRLPSPYTWSFTTAGQPPVANAGPDQDVGFGDNVALDGTQSADPDGRPLSYRWTQTSGPDVTGGAGFFTGATPSFTAPSSPATIGFDLVVNDGTSSSLPDAVRINVKGTLAGVIYASPDGDDSNPGTADAPMRTVSAAVAAAAALGNGADVYLAGGTYAQAQFTLASGVSLFGGFDGTFLNRDPATHVTVLSGGATALTAAPGVSDVRVDGLTIRSANATGAGASSYAVLIRGASGITFFGCRLEAGNGVAGSAGGAGSAGAVGQDGTDGQSGNCPELTEGGAGGGGGTGGNTGGSGGEGGDLTSLFIAQPGQSGSGPDGGPGGPAGLVTKTNHNGGAGQAGGAGIAGTDGAGGVSFGAVSEAGYEPSGGAAGGSDGTPGSGGGGGGGSSGDEVAGAGNGGGGGGGGGAPGTGGTPGGGGGGSFAIMIVGSTNIVVESCVLRTGQGGNGGGAGTGGTGGAGGSGGSGAQACRRDVGSGGSGGSGGAGGRGGHGGGGGGGPAIGIAYDASSTITETGNSYTLGNAGAGGPSPGNDGAQGARQNVLRVGAGAPALPVSAIRR